MNPYIAIAVCILILVAIFAILLIRIPAMKREMAAEEARRQEEIKRKTIERFRPLIGTRIKYHDTSLRISCTYRGAGMDFSSYAIITRVDDKGVHFLDLDTRETHTKGFDEFKNDLQWGHIILLKQKRQD